jgi:ribosomal protein S27AE
MESNRRNRRGASSSSSNNKLGSFSDWKTRNKKLEEEAKKQAAQRGGGGSIPLWKLRMTLELRPNTDPGAGHKYRKDPMEYEPFRFRFVRQTKPNSIQVNTTDSGEEYEDDIFFHTKMAWVQKYKRNVISNNHNGEFDHLPCLLWARYLTTDDEEERKQFLASDKYIAEIEILENFHQVEVTKNDSTWMEPRRCYEDDTCPYCNNDKATEAEFGKKMFLMLWGSQKRQLEEALQKYEGTCMNCGTGTIHVHGYECGSCGHTLADEHSDNPNLTLTDEKARQFTEHQTTCPKCGNVDYAEPMIECRKTVGLGKRRTVKQGCGEPIWTDPYDATFVMTFQKAGTGTAILISEPQFLTEPEEGEDFDVEIHLPERVGITKAMREVNVFDLYGTMSLKDQAWNLGYAVKDDDKGDDVPFDLDEAQAILNAEYATPPDEDDDDSMRRDD